MLRVILALAVSAFCQSNMLSVDSGRYVFGQINSIRADQFMLDTKTGRIWQMVLSDGDMVLEEVSYSKVMRVGDTTFFKFQSNPFPPDSLFGISIRKPPPAKTDSTASKLQEPEKKISQAKGMLITLSVIGSAVLLALIISNQ